MSVFPKLKLSYFAHGGLAEATRLVFFLGDVPFVDERLTEQQFAALQPELPYGQVPVLEIDSGGGAPVTVVAQSQALLRYAGRLAKLYPSSNNPIAALKVDEILNALDELRVEMEASNYEQDPEKKKQMREELAETTIPQFLDMIQPRFERLTESPGFHSKGKVLIHDVALYLLLKSIRTGVLDYIPAIIADDYDLLCTVFDKVDAHPKVQEWYSLNHPPKLKLTYVDQGGRAEPIRLAFFIGGIEFEDERVTQEELALWKPELPFHQIPVLEVDGEMLAETFPILRFAGSLSGLYPAHDALQAVRIDEILSALDEFDSKYTKPAISENDPSVQAEIYRKLTGEHIPRILGFLDKRVEKWNGEYACGDAFTIADLVIFMLVSFLKSRSEDEVPKHIAEPFKHLNRVCSNVREHPKVAEWYETHEVLT